MPAPVQPTPIPGLAGWGSRLGAYLIDYLIAVVLTGIPVVIGAILAFKDAETDELGNITGGVDPIGVVLMILGGLVFIAFGIWNRGIRVGTRGQSFGKQVLGIQVIGLETGQLLGAGSAFLRMFLGYVFTQACLLNYLWPLWDDKKQTWHDMVLKSIVVEKRS